MSGGGSGRIEEYVEESAEPEEVQKTEIPKQFEFYKVPRRFGSIPVDELPLGCDKDEQYHKVLREAACWRGHSPQQPRRRHPGSTRPKV